MSRAAGAVDPAHGRAGIRRANQRDVERLAALWIELTEHHVEIEPLFSLRAGADDEVRRLLQAQLRDPDTVIFVHGESDSIAGFCTVRIDRAPPIHQEVARAEITDVAVSPDQRRRGIGRALVESALDWVRGRGVSRVEVRVARRNTEGERFWSALGFGSFVDVLHRRL